MRQFWGIVLPGAAAMFLAMGVAMYLDHVTIILRAPARECVCEPGVRL